MFLTDAARGRLSVLSLIDNTEKILAFRFKNPVGVDTLDDGTVLVADSTLGTVIRINGQALEQSYDFGKVAIGSSKSINLSAVNVGVQP